MNICEIVFDFPDSSHEPIVSGEIKNPYNLITHLKERGHNIVVISSVMGRTADFDHKRVVDGIDVYDTRKGMLKGAVKFFLRVFMSQKNTGQSKTDIPSTLSTVILHRSSLD